MRFGLVPMFLFAGRVLPGRSAPGVAAAGRLRHAAVPRRRAVPRRGARTARALAPRSSTSACSSGSSRLAWAIAARTFTTAAVRVRRRDELVHGHGDVRVARHPGGGARPAPAAAHARAQPDGDAAQLDGRLQRVLRAALLPAVDPHRHERARRRRDVRRRADRLRRVRRPGADGVVGDERRRVRLDDERVLQAQVRTALRRGAGDADVAGRRCARRDRLGRRTRHACTRPRSSARWRRSA